MGQSSDDRMPTNMRMLRLLETLGDEKRGLNPTDLGRALGLPKQTAHRLVKILIAEGFVTHDERSNGIRPGRRAREMALGILYSSDVHVLRRQVLEQLASELGETVNYVVPQDGGMFYHDRVETDWAFRIQLPIGSSVPFHCTASGKTYLATLPKTERRRLANVMSLPRLTENTLTKPDALLDELQEVARQGFALDREEFVEGMVAVAAPIRDPRGRYFASVAVHGPTQRLTLDHAKSLAPRLKLAAQQLTDAIF